MANEVDERAVEGDAEVRRFRRKFRKPVLFRFFFGPSEIEVVDLREGGQVEAAGGDPGKVGGLGIEDLAEADVCQLSFELELCFKNWSESFKLGHQMLEPISAVSIVSATTIIICPYLELSDNGCQAKANNFLSKVKRLICSYP